MFKTALSVVGGVVVAGAAAAVGYYYYKENKDPGSGNEEVIEILEKVIDFFEDLEDKE